MHRRCALAVWGFLAILPFLSAQDKPDPLVKLKKTATENWAKIDSTMPVMAETDHLLLVAPKETEEKLKEHGALIEKHFELAVKALFKEKDKPVKGRITVYFLRESEHVDSFIRRVEKRRPRTQESGIFNAEDDKLHVAVGPPREGSETPAEVQAAQEVASLLMQRRAGTRTIVPFWLVNGFGRATYFRVMGEKDKLVQADRAKAAQILKSTKRNAQDVWNGLLEEGEPAALEPNLADFLAYGPGRMKFPALLDAFKPGENVEKHSMEQALQAVDLKVDIINKQFRVWALRPN